MPSSDENTQVQNDVVEEEAAMSSSEGRASVKRKLTVDETPRKASRRRARVSYADMSVTRLWSEEDELALLNGMIDYDKDPRCDYQAFYDFVQDSIKTNVSLRQFRDKISKLKSKYFANVNKGGHLVFVKPHDEKLFELSKKVWGVGNDNVVSQDEVEDENVVLVGEFKEMYPYLNLVCDSDVDFPNPLKYSSVVKLIACEKIKGLDKECKGVFVEDLQLYVKKLELKTQLAKAVLDQMSTSTP